VAKCIFCIRPLRPRTLRRVGSRTHGCGWCVPWAWDGVRVDAWKRLHTKTACPKFEVLALASFSPCAQSNAFRFRLLTKLPKLRARLERLEPSSRTGRSKYYITLLRSSRPTKHKRHYQITLVEIYHRANNEVDVGTFELLIGLFSVIAERTRRQKQSADGLHKLS
jgi:hypothetical protein